MHNKNYFAPVPVPKTQIRDSLSFPTSCWIHKQNITVWRSWVCWQLSRSESRLDVSKLWFMGSNMAPALPNIPSDVELVLLNFVLQWIPRHYVLVSYTQDLVQFYDHNIRWWSAKKSESCQCVAPPRGKISAHFGRTKIRMINWPNFVWRLS